jgi:hypothetical protein
MPKKPTGRKWTHKARKAQPIPPHVVRQEEEPRFCGMPVLRARVLPGTNGKKAIYTLK